MRFRKLRIAWSVGCGIACVLLIVLWVRSYTPTDELKLPIGFLHFAHFDTYHGELRVLSFVTSTPRGFDYDHVDVADLGNTPYAKRRFYFARPENSWGIFELWLPFWFLSLVGTGIAVLPWLPWRFSLRTLLIATTIVAVVLGLVVWSLH
jgi:hypothetical protein